MSKAVKRRTLVIGAGVGGLTAALELAAAGHDVTVLERAATPGGKLREIDIGGLRIDAGPTVFTLRSVFDELFESVGASLDDHVKLRPAETLARHAWDDRGMLDLYADVERSADAIGGFSGASAARGYRAFCDRAQRTWQTLEHTFVRGERTTPLGLAQRVGLPRIAALMDIAPFATLWSVLGEYFSDPRLRQLFGRYATYMGSSPFCAPATLMLIAHVERSGVWTVEGGMYRIVRALESLATARGARFRYAAHAGAVLMRAGRVAGVRLADGEVIEADAVIANVDAGAIANGGLGPEAAAALQGSARCARSLSAVTWALTGEVQGFPLLHHSVFFSPDYEAEFASLVRQGQLPAAPTVYVCAQDRSGDTPRSGGTERLLCLVNAPATGDRHDFPAAEIEACESRTFEALRRCGLKLRRDQGAARVTTPADFERLFPGTGGALYGPASNHWNAAFKRQGARTTIPGLYLAGGSTHPGAGVPMALLSGRQAAAALLRDRGSTRRSRPAATRGGTSMR